MQIRSGRLKAAIASTLLILLFQQLAGAPRPFDSDSTPAGGQWLIKVSAGNDPVEVARAVGAEYVGALSWVEGYHRVKFYQQLQARPDDPDIRELIYRQLESQPGILAFEEERMITRYPKVFNPLDPYFPDQWHLENIGQSGGYAFSDIRVRPVWDKAIDGTGVVIAVIDTGIEFLHPDLQPNWITGSGYDYNDDDSNPSPVGSDDRHGTAVAGISLAAANGIGGLGVAFDAELVPLRLISGPFPSGAEADALSYQRQLVDIYNNSWGPSDDAGVRYAASSQVMQDAVASNVRFGRGGLGNIYVWAAGNGGLNGDNSNYDGYNSLPYTISVGAIGHDDIKAGYSEPGANLLVVAPSGGRGAGILTTDNTGLSGYAPGDVFSNFSGTSAAAPIVSGVVALLLEQRPDLNWRDVQQVLAKSASPVDFIGGQWEKNAAGYWVSHEYGFGRVNADAASNLAEVWQSLGSLQNLTGVQTRQTSLLQNITSTGKITINSGIEVQFVRVELQLNHSDWGDISVELVSPGGTRSILAEPHANANSTGQPGVWTYLSTHHLGESSQGDWFLEVTDKGFGGSGSWVSWELTIMGHDRSQVANSDPQADDLSIQSINYPVEINVLEGVTDSDGDNLEIISIQNPSAGILQNLGNGIFSYTMGDTPNGMDFFSVLIGDGKGGVKRRVVSVLDPRPVVRNDLYTVVKGTTADLPVLNNDVDPDGDSLRLVRVGGSFPGQAFLLNDQVIRYQAPPDFNGVVRIQYTIADDSDGQASGFATVVVQDTAEIALQFDGEDDYVRLSPTTQVVLSDNFTVEAWINPSSYGEYVTGFGRIYDRDTFVFFLTGFDHAFYNDRSLVVFIVGSDGRSFAANSPSGTILLNEWQHVAVSYNSSSANPVSLYVNGLPVGVNYPSEVSPTRPNVPVQDNRGSSLYIGEADSGARAFEGRMSEFRIWNGVLGSTTILQRANTRLNGTEAGLQMYLPLDRTLDSYAVSLGAYSGNLAISGAERVPLDFPWNNLEGHYSFIQDSGSGWWRDLSLDWMHGDEFPWVYLLSVGWVYTGHQAGSNTYSLYFEGGNWGWMQTSAVIYPWYYRPEDGKWLWYLENSYNPPLFYDVESSEWITFDGLSAN